MIEVLRPASHGVIPNNLHLSLVIAILLAVSGPVLPAEQDSPEQVVTRFYDASVRGDIEELQPLMAGSFLNRRQALLADPGSYSDFLVNYYKQTVVTIANVTVDQDNGVAAVEVSISRDGESQNTVRLLLQKFETGEWKIVSQDDG